MLVFVIASCRHAQPTTTPQATPPPPAEQPMAAPLPVQKIESPAQPADTVLTQDVSTLNQRGYLKDVFFDFDKALLREDARAALAADAQWLKQYPSIQVLVEGHCDERGTEEYNLALGQRRAMVVKDYVDSLGVDSSRVKTISYGKDRAFCEEHGEACWQENRRGHFVITAK